MRGTIRIEPYQPLGVRTPAVPGGSYINVDASAGRFGPALGWPFGVGIAEGLGGMAPEVAEQLGRDNEATVKGADTRLGEAERTLLSDPQRGYLNTQGQDALTHSAAVLEAYAMAQDREAAALSDDDQRRMFDELAPRRLASFSAQVERHAAAERQRWHDTAGDRRIALMQADAGQYWNDDALLRRALGTARAEVRDKAKRHGWDTTQTETSLLRETSRTLVVAIEAAVERDTDRAQALRRRYDKVIEERDRAGLDALLAEALTRRQAEDASATILSGTQPDGQAPPLDTRTGRPTLDWQLEQAESIAEPAVRAATIRRLRSADAEAEAAAEARARALGEQVLARVLKDGLTDPSQIFVREWVVLDAEHRQAIESMLDHNLRGDEPAPNPALVDELATQMTRAPRAFVRRDLVPLVARLPMSQWQRFREWQAGIRRDDPATEETFYAIRRGLQIVSKMLPTSDPDTADDATKHRAELVEEIDTWRRITGKSPDDADIAGMLERHIAPEMHVRRTLEGNSHHRPEVHLAQSNYPWTAAAPLPQIALPSIPLPRIAGGLAALEGPAACVLGGAVAAGAANELDAPILWRHSRLLAKNAPAVAAKMGFVPVDNPPIDAHGEMVFFNPDLGEYIVRATDVRTPGVWERFDRHGNRLGFHSRDLRLVYDDPPINPGFTWAQPRRDAAGSQVLEAKALTPDEKKQLEKELAAKKIAAAMAKGGVTVTPPPPPEGEEQPPEDDEEDKTTPPDPNRHWRENIKYETDPIAEAAARKLGYYRVKNPGIDSKDNAVFKHPRKGDYISRDDTNHKGTWKRFDKTTLERTGTWNADLSRKLGK